MPATTRAAISFVSAAATSTASTVSPEDVLANDIIFVTAFRPSNTLCTLPPGWTAIATSTGGGYSTYFAYKIAASNGETSGNWINCTKLEAVVYRGENAAAPLGAMVKTTGMSATITYGGISLTKTDGSSWVIASAYHAAANTVGAQVPPSGMAYRTDTGSPAPRLGAHDTNTSVAAWTSKNVAVSGTNYWASYVQELLSATPDILPPVSGASGTITASNLYDTSLTLNWTAATDDSTDQSALQYAVYQSASPNIDTVANIEANGTMLSGYSSSLTSFNVDNLPPATTYYYNVIVKDLAGWKTAYSMQAVTTQPPCSRNMVNDFSAGTDGAVLESSTLDASSWGVTGLNWSVVNPGSNLLFSSVGSHPLGGTIPAQCAKPWPGEGQSMGASILIDNNYRYARFALPSDTADTVTAGYWFKSDYPRTQTNVNIDSFDIKGATGNPDFVNVPFQIENGTQLLGLETASNSGTGCVYRFSPYPINENTWYWVTLQYTDLTDGSKGMRMSIYDENLNLVNQIVSDESVRPCNPQKAAEVKFGHYAVTPPTNLPGSHLYYDDIMVCDKGTCPFPLLPESGPDVTAPAISNVASSTDQTTATVSWITDELATSTLQYGLSTQYGSTTPSIPMTTTPNFLLTNLPSNTLYHFRAISSDASGNVATSTDYTFTTAPEQQILSTTISDIISTTTATTATISWLTNQDATSSIQYGLDTQYGSFAASLIATTTPSFTLTDLAPDTLYHFQVTSSDPLTGSVSSLDNTFLTQPVPPPPPPILSLGAPTGTLPATTTSVTLSVQTDQSSTCKFGTTANTPYDGMADTFETTGGTSHASPLSGLNAGTYTYYIRCENSYLVQNSSDYVISFTIPSLVDITTGLQGYWKFEEGSGTLAYDSSANGRTATLMKSTTWTNGYSGGGVQFDGVKNYIQLPVSLGSYSDFTVTAWVDCSFSHLNCGIWSGGGNRALLRDTSEYLTWNGTTKQGVTTPSNANTWVFVSFVRSGTTLFYYRNGSLVLSYDIGSQPVNFASSILGTDSIYYFGNSLTGVLDSFRIYDRALSPDELQTVMSSN